MLLTAWSRAGEDHDTWLVPNVGRVPRTPNIRGISSSASRPPLPFPSQSRNIVAERLIGIAEGVRVHAGAGVARIVSRLLI